VSGTNQFNSSLNGFGSVKLISFTITMGGQEHTYYRNEENSALPVGAIGGNGYDYLFNQAAKNSYRAYGDVNSSCANISFINWTNTNVNQRLAVPIIPGAIADIGIYNSNSSSVYMRLSFVFSAALPTNTKLVLFKKNPEQLTVDENSNVTLNMWPTIAGSNEYLLANVTNAQ